MTIQIDDIIAYVFVTWYVFMIILSILGQCVAQLRYNKKPKPKSSSLPLSQVPGVSILRPMKGLDLELEANLRSSFQQDYPKFELLFSVASADDPCIPVVQRLMNEYTKVDSRLIIGEQIVGINPKINNMIQSYNSAKYDIIWILDSNVHVDENTLGRSVDELQKPGIGLVHHLPMATQPASYAAQVEQVFLNTNHAKMYLAINAVGIASCVMGKSNLYRRSDLDKVGGLAMFGKYMAEDNIVGEALWAQGLRHAMSADMACQVLGKISPKEYCGRRARWVRLRKYIVTAATLTEPFTESIVCGSMGAWALHHLWPTTFTSMTYVFVLHWIAWCMNDYWLYRTLLDQSSSPVIYRSKKLASQYAWPDFLRAWITREVLALPLYLYAMVGTEISWRHQRYRCLSDGTAVAI
ncbi:glycosyltransferase family 21 protein [Halteromyces radiatus]|uniref:glycosyltransferase family 21 protein n=1 Tax=Halteromyces radiatus TaxID=101107 RepID=UPI00221F0C29|nr:glycosyltransferase family 21 protein [Halteromyces radiatus]KAI8096866.1 glycosyltransferase family 21 protein [Halteromyces radiatus]